MAVWSAEIMLQFAFDWTIAIIKLVICFLITVVVVRIIRTFVSIVDNGCRAIEDEAEVSTSFLVRCLGSVVRKTRGYGKDSFPVRAWKRFRDSEAPHEES